MTYRPTRRSSRLLLVLMLVSIVTSLLVTLSLSGILDTSIDMLCRAPAVLLDHLTGSQR